MAKILRSAMAGAIAGGIVFGVGTLMRHFLLSADEMDMWSFAVLLSIASGFEVDRAFSSISPDTAPAKRVAFNVLHGAGWAAAMFVVFDVLSRVFGDRSGVPTVAEMISLACSVVVVGIWRLSFRTDDRAARARAQIEREARSVEIRRQARAVADDLARHKPDSNRPGADE